MSAKDSTSKNIKISELEKQRKGERRFQRILEDGRRSVYGIELDYVGKPKKENKDATDHN